MEEEEEEKCCRCGGLTMEEEEEKRCCGRGGGHGCGGCFRNDLDPPKNPKEKQTHWRFQHGKLFALDLTKGPEIRGKPRGWWCEINSSDYGL